MGEYRRISRCERISPAENRCVHFSPGENDEAALRRPFPAISDPTSATDAQFRDGRDFGKRRRRRARAN